MDLLDHDALMELQNIRLLSLDQISELSLSMRYVRRIDASGVASLLRLQSNLERQGKRLWLRDVGSELAAELKLIGADLVFNVELAEASVRAPVKPFKTAGSFTARLLAMLF